jgi:2-keto-4-pentenoate hydratase
LIAIDQDDISLPLGSDLPNDWLTFNKVLEALRQFAPAIEFTALRRAYAPSVDVEAIIRNA